MGRNKYVTEELLSTRIEDFNLSNTATKIIKRNGCNIMRDLLSRYYNEILNWRVSQQIIQEIKDFVHGYGMVITNEYPTFEEIDEAVKLSGQIPISSIPDFGFIYRKFYRLGIYTVQDLIEYGYLADEMELIGPKRKEKFHEILKEQNIQLKEKSNEKVSLLYSAEDILEIIINKRVADRLEREKNQVLLKEQQEREEEEYTCDARQEYDRLLREKESLLSTYKELISQRESLLKAANRILENYLELDKEVEQFREENRVKSKLRIKGNE